MKVGNLYFYDEDKIYPPREENLRAYFIVLTKQMNHVSIYWLNGLYLGHDIVYMNSLIAEHSDIVCEPDK